MQWLKRLRESLWPGLVPPTLSPNQEFRSAVTVIQVSEDRALKILFALPYVPSLIRARPYNFIRELSDRHEIHVLAVSPVQEIDDAGALREFCRGVEVVPLRRFASLRSCATAAVRGEPLQSAVCRSPALAHRLADLLAREHFDIVHVEHLRAAHLGELLPDGIPKLFDSVDCISHLLRRTLLASHSPRQRILALLELHRTRAYEKRLLSRFDRVVVTSLEDARALRELEPSANITVVPIGVDLDRFRPVQQSREPATLVFSGKMSYHANITAVLHFTRNVLPRIRQRHPEVRLRIVGTNPPAVIRALEKDRAITVTGYVRDMSEALGSASIAICPVIVKAGLQFKILEAMAMGLPVVCTRQGAEGLRVEHERNILVGNDSDEFADHVCRLLADTRLADRLGRAGREYVETHHQWGSAARQLESLYDETIKQRRGIITASQMHH
jgi:polysaccharide biosynthesis protein PslH